jgi:hypothetical protein
MSDEKPQVEYRRLGKSGLRVSVPILGAMSFGDPAWGVGHLSYKTLRFTESVPGMANWRGRGTRRFKPSVIKLFKSKHAGSSSPQACMGKRSEYVGYCKCLFQLVKRSHLVGMGLLIVSRRCIRGDYWQSDQTGTRILFFTSNFTI